MEEDLGRVQGWAGWSPVPAIADRGADKVMVIADFVGGEDNKPTSEIGKYVGVDGLVSDIEDAVPLPKGATGEKPKMNSTSITSNVIGTGAKTFTLATPLDMVVGEVVKAYSLADPNNYVCGFIFSITPTEIVITVSEIGGVGTKTDWVIVSSAFQGKQGITTTNMSSGKVLGRITAGVGTPEELTPVGLTLIDNKIYSGTEQGVGTLMVNAFNLPKGGLYKGAASETGAIRIKLPTSGAFQTMMLIHCSLYDFTNEKGGSFSIKVYPYIMNRASAVFIGNTPYTVRWYTDGLNRYIYIGELTTTWAYPSLVINRVETSYSTGLPLISEGWIISLETEFVGILEATRLPSQTLPNSNPYQILSEYNAASGVDTPLTNAMNPLQMFQNLQKQNDNRYTKSEADAKILAINIGGRNLIKASKATYTGIGNFCTYELSEPLIQGETYTATMRGISGVGAAFQLWVDNASQSACRINNTAGIETVSTTFVFWGLTGNPYYAWLYSELSANPSTIYWVKIEKGNKATDWTPAPEDLEAYALGKANDAQTAAQNYADAQDASNLQAAKDDATAKVNTVSALKADIAAATGTLVALTFTSDSVQGTVASPLTGNITGNITGAKLGVVTLVIHNHTTAPTFDSKYKKLSGSGSYVTGSINYIFCEYINDTEIIYSINQRT